MLIFSALSDPTRLSIVELLARQGPTPASAIAEHFSCTPSAISQHLNHLVKCGMLTRTAKGQQRWYAVHVQGLKELEDWLVRTRWFCTQNHGGG